MGAAPVPKFVRSLTVDFPDICPQFFLGNSSRQEGETIHKTVYIFMRLLTRQDGLQNRDYRNYSI